VEHDAKAGLLAEWYFGAARGARNAVFLTMGTGLGCGVLVGGHLLRGANDRAGEVGHWRMARTGPAAYGKRGSWEAFSSGAGLPALARHLYGPDGWGTGLTAADLVGLAREGDPRAERVVHESARRLGRGIALLVDLLDPEVVVLGSLVVRAGDLYLPIIERTVAREVLPRPRACRIVAAELGERLGDVAALTVAIHRLRHGAPTRPARPAARA
jgi:glucokinase